MTEDTVLRESGHHGEIVSLGGISDKTGRGLVVVGGSFTMPSGTYRQIISANARRVWATVFNFGPDDVSVKFGPDASTDAIVVLGYHEYLQIDRDLPWIGEVYAGGAVSAVCYVWEAAING